MPEPHGKATLLAFAASSTLPLGSNSALEKGVEGSSSLSSFLLSGLPFPCFENCLPLEVMEWTQSRPQNRSPPHFQVAIRKPAGAPSLRPRGVSPSVKTFVHSVKTRGPPVTLTPTSELPDRNRSCAQVRRAVPSLRLEVSLLTICRQKGQNVRCGGLPLNTNSNCLYVCLPVPQRPEITEKSSRDYLINGECLGWGQPKVTGL